MKSTLVTCPLVLGVGALLVSAVVFAVIQLVG